MLSSSDIKAIIHDSGIELCGIVPPLEMDDDTEFLRQWMDDGLGSTLDYLRRNTDMRRDITCMVPGARSVITCVFPYRNRFSGTYPGESDRKIASYALSEDYHIRVRRCLRSILAKIQGIDATVNGRVFTDSAPIFEKAYAVMAGLGWIGRQSLLVTPMFGTYVLLGEIVIDSECDIYDTPYSGTRCGTCRRCMDACPNGAVMDRHIDCRRCISCSTVEKEADERIQLHGWIFGCDECQACCPYSMASPITGEAAFDPLSVRWETMTDDEFRDGFTSTPLSRSGLDRIRRNVESNKKHNP